MISSLTHEILERVEREVDKKYLVQENEVINLGGRTLKMKTKEDDWWRDKETPEELKEREENSKKKEKITRIATRRIQKTARIKEDNIGREKMSNWLKKQENKENFGLNPKEPLKSQENGGINPIPERKVAKMKEQLQKESSEEERISKKKKEEKEKFQTLLRSFETKIEDKNKNKNCESRRGMEKKWKENMEKERVKRSRVKEEESTTKKKKDLVEMKNLTKITETEQTTLGPTHNFDFDQVKSNFRESKQ